MKENISEETVLIQFPDFDNLAIFNKLKNMFQLKDCSCHHDSLPSLKKSLEDNKQLFIFIDYKDIKSREYPDTEEFSLLIKNNNDIALDTQDFENVNDLIQYINKL